MSYIPVLQLSIKCTAAHPHSRFVSLTGGVPAAGANTYGVAIAAGVLNQITPVIAQGLVRVETGAAIAVNALVECDATGRAITRTTGAIVGRMAPDQAAASAAGQMVEILPITN